MILQDSNAPVALRVVTGGVKKRDSDHSDCRGYCQRSDPPVELKFKIERKQIKQKIAAAIHHDYIFAGQPEKEADESGVAKKHLEDCRDGNRSLDLAHPHLV